MGTPGDPMGIAMDEARAAAARGEVPVGAVLL
ncbi:nucleoside deaminase, partial [Nguyenibacter vanlangensis]|nr:nucleoside deaminase [Nguyenibacter vanlangensis]